MSDQRENQGQIDPDAVEAVIRARAIAAAQATGAEYVPHQPHVRQKLFLDLQHLEAFYGGAAGGGKSDALLMAALEHVDKPGYAALLLRRTYADLILPEALMDRARAWLSGTPAKWIEKEKTWLFPSGARLTFGYLESENDKYRYQSSAFQFIGFDELTQFTETQYLYLFSRLRRLANVDVPLRMRSASNPGNIGAFWVRSRFVPDDFIPEYATEPKVWIKRGFDSAGNPVERSFVPARISDNPFLDAPSYIHSLNQLDRVEREKLLKGDWTISNARMRFDAAAVNLFQPVQPSLGELVIVDDERQRVIHFRQNDNGLLAVWRRPSRGKQYVIGADTAQGLDRNDGQGEADPDYSVAQVRDLDTGEQVARLRGRLTERAFGEYLYLLGIWFNHAFIVPEVTGGHGRAALDKLLDLGYPTERIYHRQNEMLAHKPRYDDLGWQTNTVTRPQLISALDTAILEHSIETYDAVTIQEYRSFIINKDGKTEAMQGAHDDCVIADALSVVGIRRAPRVRRDPVQTGQVAHYGPAARPENRDDVLRRRM